MNGLCGVILAGGKGTRLYPLTRVASKQLIPVYNKPMIYYPLTTLMLAGIKDILLITRPEDVLAFKNLLGDGAQWGISIGYAEQPCPRGIAEALIIGAEFINGRRVLLTLGDNIIFGRYDFLRAALEHEGAGATIFAYQVTDPSAYGVVEFDADRRVKSLEEKPDRPRSTWAVPGLYLYDEEAARRASRLSPSARGEYEITDLNLSYLRDDKLLASPMGRGVAWFDTGTPDSLQRAAGFIEAVESRQGLVIGSPEEVAFRTGWISRSAFVDLLERMPSCAYRTYLNRIVLTDAVDD